MLLFREKIPADWLPKVMANLPAVLVESEGNHYATYLLMARALDEPEADRRLDFYLDLEAKLIRERHDRPILH